MKNSMRPIHPGEILKDELMKLNINATSLAKILGVPVNRVTGIINCKRSITANTALRLSRYFGTTPEFWLNLQSSFDLKIVERKLGKKINKQIHPYFEAA